AKTRAERTANGDPRPSLEERYTDANGLVRAVERATRELVEQRFLLQEDADRFVAAAQASAAMQPAGPAPQHRLPRRYLRVRNREPARLKHHKKTKGAWRHARRLAPVCPFGPLYL